MTHRANQTAIVTSGPSSIANEVADFDRHSDDFGTASIELAKLAAPRHAIFDPNAAKTALDLLAKSWPSNRREALAARFQSLARPADRPYVGLCLGSLMAAYPNLGKGELEVYARLLLEDVIDAKPSLLVLERACRAVRRTTRFLPSIAEVLAAIRSEQEGERRIERRLASFDGDVERAQQLIARAEADLEFIEHRRRQEEALHLAKEPA